MTDRDVTQRRFISPKQLKAPFISSAKEETDEGPYQFTEQPHNYCGKSFLLLTFVI